MNFKKMIPLKSIFLCYGITVYAQVGINTTNPDQSSILDVTSTTKGVLVPRMTTAQRDLIGSPATGLLIYETSIDKFSGRNTSNWTQDVFGDLKWNLNGNSNTNAAVNFLGTIKQPGCSL